MKLVILAEDMQYRVAGNRGVPSINVSTVSHVIDIHVIVRGDIKFPRADIPASPQVAIQV